MTRLLCTFLFLLFLGLVEPHTQLPACELTDEDIFPDDFVFGSASSSYQIEGAWNLDGKGPNIWDVGTHDFPDRIKDESNGDIAADSYHKYMEDVKALNETGFKSYRFSISWSRIMPSGESSTLNQAGLDYYHRLIDALLENGIEPSVTMYHWDLPQPLQDLGGFLNPLFVNFFEDYADVLFREYGHKVKWWSTFNEPVEVCEVCYGRPTKPPFINGAENGGEYYCAYHLLLAHARAYRLYDEKYRETQQGRVGIVLSYNYFYPADGEDYYNSERGMQYTVGLYAHPIFTDQGGWPEILQQQVDENSRLEGRMWSRLPEMDDETKTFIRGTADWFGLNYYSSYLVEPDGGPAWKTGLDKDKGLWSYKDESWETAESDWLHRVPEGLRDCLYFIKKYYNNPEIWITENGWSDVGQINDGLRVRYYREHLQAVLQAIKCDEVNVKQYYAWSIIDNFEWMVGYTQRFGLYHVDFEDPERPRTPKDSARFFAEVTQSRSVPAN